MTDDARHGLDRLTHDANLLALLIELLGGSGPVVGDTGGDPIPHGGHGQDLARELYRTSRVELRRDCDAIQHRDQGATHLHPETVEAVATPALKAAYVALSSGSVLQPRTMLVEATRARGVLDEAVRGVQRLEGE